MLIKKQVFEKIGLFDEKYFMWAEEADFCVRATKEKFKLFCCAKSKVWHKEGASTGLNKQKSIFKRKSLRPTLKRFIITGYLDVRNNIYFVKKHWGRFYMWAYICGPNMIKLEGE